jgi:hypothetical protein
MQKIRCNGKAFAGHAQVVEERLMETRIFVAYFQVTVEP